VVYDIVRRLPADLVTLAHEGTKAYSEAFELVVRREADAPNAIWQADQMCIRDSNHGAEAYHVLYQLIGTAVSILSESDRAAARLLRHPVQTQIPAKQLVVPPSPVRFTPSEYCASRFRRGTDALQQPTSAYA